MKIWSLFACVMFFSSSLFGQEGYKLSVQFKNVDTGILRLFVIRGSESFIFKTDSFKITKPNQLATFVQSKKILGSVYLLQLGNDKKNKAKVVLDNGSVIQAEVSGNNMNTFAAKDELNKLFSSIQSGLLGQAELEKAYQKVTLKYPKSVLELYCSLDKAKRQAKIALQKKDSVKAREIFFKSVDLNDKRLSLLPNAYAYMYEFSQTYATNNNSYKSFVDKLLKGKSCKDRNYMFILEWVFKNLESYLQENLNETYKYTYDKYLNNDSCANVDAKFYGKITESIAHLSDMKVGITIPDFSMQDSLGTKYTLHNELKKAKYTFLVFYDPDCEHCKTIIPESAKYIKSQKYSPSLMQLIAFRNATDSSKWQAFIREKNIADWLNVCPYQKDASYVNQLKVFNNPKAFLIDRKGVIKALNFDFNAIQKVLMD